MISKEIGFAGDLFIGSRKYFELTGGMSVPELKPLLSICDLFLIHDMVSFRADKWTLRELYSCFTLDELDELIKFNRIRFYQPIYQPGYHENWEVEIHKFFKTSPDILFRKKIDPNKATKQVFDHIGLSVTVEDYSQLKSEMNTLFYKEGIQRDSFFTRDVEIGFDQSIEKIRELWSCGIFSTFFDHEVLFYFDICNKAAFLKEKHLPISELNSRDNQLVDQLHAFKNMPSLSELLVKSDNPTRTFLQIINSTEAIELKSWIQKVDDKNVDIRDLYQSAITNLPSKNKWVDWLRFGGVTVISGILAGIVTANPALGMLVGGAIGTADKAYGEKLIDKTSKDYNPESWISFIEKVHHRQ